MTKKCKHRIDTMDGPIEYEDDIPPSPRRTPEEEEEERARLYPTEDIAFYLQYPCEVLSRQILFGAPPPRQEYESL